MSPDQIFKKEYAIELFRIAQGDLESAHVLAQSKKGRMENSCFHAEQAVEKALKAVLCHLEIAVPLSHNLELIVSKIPKKHRPPRESQIGLLTEFATIRRYEEGAAVLSDADVKAALDIAESIINWAQNILQ